LPTKPVLDFVFFDAGGGHRSAALALKSVIDSQDRGWEVRLVNLQEVLDPLDIFRKLSGIRLEDVYNRGLAKGWTLGSEYLLRLMHGVIRYYHHSQVKLLTPFWRERQPSLVVSLVPNFNRAIFQSMGAGVPGVPLVTVLTDFADYPPHFWIEKQQAQYFICGTNRAVEQALKLGHSQDRVFRVSGMILRPDFYETAHVDKAAERAKLGLAPDVPTGILLFGGQGSPEMRRITQSLGDSRQDLQLIAICGRNARLKRQLETMKTRNRVFVEGFTSQIPFYMQLSDFLIGKPGPGSISEAVQMHLPVIVECNRWTLPQERYNADWVREQNVGIVLEDFRDIERGVSELLANVNLEKMRSRAVGLENRAVFEIPEVLAGLLGIGQDGWGQ
jgi:UDP-N-acetylglucosamine:LPS N-acetylglucosamine transferase